MTTEEGAAAVFGGERRGRGGGACIAELHAKIGELTMECVLLSGALGRMSGTRATAQSQSSAGNKTQRHGLPPVVFAKSRILILGTMPGEESLRLQQYYANPRNQFWAMPADAYGAPVGDDYQQKLRYLEERGLGLSDVLEGAERIGSLDSAIRDETPNDLPAFLQAHPSLEIGSA